MYPTTKSPVLPAVVLARGVQQASLPARNPETNLTNQHCSICNVFLFRREADAGNTCCDCTYRTS